MSGSPRLRLTDKGWYVTDLIRAGVLSLDEPQPKASPVERERRPAKEPKLKREKKPPAPRSSRAKSRGTCPVCCRSLAVMVDGRMLRHSNSRSERCLGWGLKAEEYQ